MLRPYSALDICYWFYL